MSERTTSRAFGSPNPVSHCPICKYSLAGLAGRQLCPECGVEINRDLYSSPAMQDAIFMTKTWCSLGGIGWFVSAFAYWAYSMVYIQVINGYYPGSFGINDLAGVWLRTAFVVAPLSLSISWLFGARQLIYLRAIKNKREVTRVPRRIVAVGLIGILLGLGGALLILMMISSI